MNTKESKKMSISEIPTPAFLVDLEKVKRNCLKMRTTAATLGVKLRVQTKTHKTITGAILQTDGDKRCVVVSTLPEAELYAAHGFDDILYGYPFTPNKLKRCRDLALKLQEFHLMIDNSLAVQTLVSAPLPEGKVWSVFLALDCGYGREGVEWDSSEALQLAKEINSHASTIYFAGVYVHCGNSYSSETQNIAKQTTERILQFVKKLSSENIKCPVFGTGSTPTCSQPIKELGGLNEIHPGNYIFYDAMQWKLGSCEEKDIAVRIATRVIGHKPKLNQIIIDCGWEGISLDGAGDILPTGYAYIQGHSNLKLKSMTQEIGKIVALEGKIDYEKYPIGSMLFLYPYHSCASASMHSVYYVTENDEIVDQWYPVRGW